MLRRLRKVSLLILASYIIIFFLSCASADDVGAEYSLEFVAFRYQTESVRGESIFKVVSFDSRSDTLQTVARDFENSVVPIFCELDDSKTGSGFTGHQKTYQIMNSDEVSQLVSEYSLLNVQIGQRLGSCYEKAGIRLQSITCNAFRYVPDADIDKDTESLFQCYLLIDEQSQEIIFVDAIVFPRGRTSMGPFEKGFFSSDGQYFYYSKDGLVKRFNIQKRVIDDISGGNVPLIPWNREGVVVYSEKEHLFKLLSQDGTVKATVKQKIRPSIRSVYAIDSTTFVCSSLAPPKNWYPPNDQEVYVIDIATGTSRRLIKRVSLLQILDAKRVN